MAKIERKGHGFNVIGSEGSIIGHVYRDRAGKAWSYAPWLILGDTRTQRGGRGFVERRRYGYRARYDAVAAVRLRAVLR